MEGPVAGGGGSQWQIGKSGRGEISIIFPPFSLQRQIFLSKVNCENGNEIPQVFQGDRVLTELEKVACLAQLVLRTSDSYCKLPSKLSK
jgi:hypothetical protein